jgi:radical SAM superfamily enzyme YgiQ (UPF0313 family)
MTARILLINPWITDFAAHDLWARPLGLLCLGGVLRQIGYEPVLIDCTDRSHPSLPERPYRPKAFSCGKYPSVEIEKPAALKGVPRAYKRYGISLDAFRESLDASGEPALILVGSRMTYWYPGVQTAIALLRERFPRVPTVLGGVYATLYRAHATAHSGAGFIIGGEGENALIDLVNSALQPRSPAPHVNLADLDSLPAPAYDLLSNFDTLPLAASRGCPRRCTYCASRRLFGRFRRRDPLRAAADLMAWVEARGFRDIAFYDDALLAGARDHFLPFCDRLIAAGFRRRFHTPNGLDFAAIDQRVAERMARLRVETIRLSLETADPARLARLGRVPDLARFERALRVLGEAGYDLRRVGVYILFGLPGQTRAEIERTVQYVLDLGATPKLGEFSPLPDTAEWDRARRESGLPLETEPLLANNSAYFRFLPEFPETWVNELRNRIRSEVFS